MGEGRGKGWGERGGRVRGRGEGWEGDRVGRERGKGEREGRRKMNKGPLKQYEEGCGV